MDNQLLAMAIENGQAEIRYGGIIEIYPRRFMNSFLLETLLASLGETHTFVRVMDCIRAFEKEVS